MNRRTQGKVKQAQKRKRIRNLVHQGLRLSMMERIHNTGHQHNHEQETYVAPTHELVYKANGNVIARGTENEMRRERTKLGAEYTARKIKVAV